MPRNTYDGLGMCAVAIFGCEAKKSTVRTLLYRFRMSLAIKRLDRMVIRAFLGPFGLALGVVVFVFVLRFMLSFLEDVLGKGLSLAVYLKLFVYFGVSTTPFSFPVATLLAAIIAFSGLSQHAELTAIKGAGVSMARLLLPLGVVVAGVAGVALWCNTYWVPKANLKGYSLLYDLKMKKPALDIKEGVFYQAIPDYSIKVGKKSQDHTDVQGIVIHQYVRGSHVPSLTLASRGKIFTQDQEKFLVIDLAQGNSYYEGQQEKGLMAEGFVHMRFARHLLQLDLASFGLHRTREELFSHHRIMHTSTELGTKIDKVRAHIEQCNRHQQQALDSLVAPPQHVAQASLPSDWLQHYTKRYGLSAERIAQRAFVATRNAAEGLRNSVVQKERLRYDVLAHEVEWHKRYAFALGCLALFLVGAPVGTLVRKGGLGIPIVVTACFFLLYYVLSILGERWAKMELLPVVVAMWMPNMVFLPIGVWLLGLARRDVRLMQWS